ncbi:MAG: hypothetical protein H8E57_00435 [Candidatus Cloacimonetes bacterium]|nr:hypothetical protein [Candidatus Cloacimonadota bacterium]
MKQDDLRTKTNLRLDNELIENLKHIARIKGISYSDLVNLILSNFVNTLNLMNSLNKKGSSKEMDDQTYLDYVDSLRDFLSNSGIPKKSGDFLVG